MASRSRTARAPTPDVPELEPIRGANSLRVVATTDSRTARFPDGGRTTAAAGLLAHGSSGFDAPSRGLRPQWHSIAKPRRLQLREQPQVELRSLFGPRGAPPAAHLRIARK